MMTAGLHPRRVLDPAREVLRVVREQPAAIVVREPTCVRFGPMMPTVTGLPLIAWQPMHAPRPRTAARPRAASPARAASSSNVSPAGSGVVGTACAGSCSRGNAMKPACVRRGAPAAGVAGAALRPAPRAASRSAPRRAAPAPARHRRGGRCDGAGTPRSTPDAPPTARTRSGVTVNARNFMFACDAPQYSAQMPFHACVAQPSPA